MDMNNNNNNNNTAAKAKVSMAEVMPTMSRRFPETLEYMLPLRHSMKRYKMNMGRVVTSNETPESDGDDLSNGRIFTMAAYPPILGHAVVTNDLLCTCESMYMDVRDYEMADVVSKLPINSLKWLVGSEPNFTYPNTVESGTLMSAASEVYTKGGPLCLYDNHAVVESMNHSPTNSFWHSLYPPLEKVESHYGAVGVVHDNITVSLGTVAGDENNANLEERIPKTEHAGFLDACYTPSSKASGKVRTMAFSATKRVRTIRTRQIAAEILSVMKTSNAMAPKTWVVRCEGICTETSERCVTMMVNAWKKYCELDMPVIHIFNRNMSRKVMVISMAQGVVIRPIRWRITTHLGTKRQVYSHEGPYVDTTAVYGSDTMAFAGISFPKPEEEPEQFFSIIALLVPFAAWTAEPRLNLGVQMMRQGLSVTPVKGDATMVATGINDPIVVTPLGKLLMENSTDEIPLAIPGKNMVAAFINRTLNTEDACSISKELAESGMFAWSGFIDYPLPRNAGHIRVGMTVKDQYWWAPAIEGVIMDIRMSKVGDPIAVVYVASKSIMLGDKLATQHGLKFTVGEIVPYNEMPGIIDTKTGREFKPNLLISTKNLARGLGGQVREMAAITSMFESIESFRTTEMTRTRDAKVLAFSDQKRQPPSLPNGEVVVNGKRLTIMDTDGSMRTIRATYGIMRIMQLRHMSALKHHYPSTSFQSITVPRGRYRLGTPRLSEGELLSLIMQRCPAVVRDAIITDNLVVFTSCSVCDHTVIGCDCPYPKPPMIEKQVRYSLLVLTVYVEVATMNDPNGPAISLKFMTRT